MDPPSIPASPLDDGPGMGAGTGIALPEALVTEVLGATDTCTAFASDLLDTATELQADVRAEVGTEITQLDPQGDSYDTVAGIDGSYTVVEGAGMSIGLCAAVSVGTDIHHITEVVPAPSSPEMTSVCQGLMTMLELQTLTAPETELVIYDGSFFAALATLRQLLTRSQHHSSHGIWPTVESLIDKHLPDSATIREAFADRAIVGAPKSVSSTYFIEQHYPDYVGQFSDRAFFSLLLEPGEYYLYERPNQSLSVDRTRPSEPEPAINQLITAFAERDVLLCFYKPAPEIPAYQLEIPRSPPTAGRYEQILRSFSRELLPPPAIEPYPQWVADEICTTICGVTDAIEEGVEHELAAAGYDPSGVQTLLQGYKPNHH